MNKVLKLMMVILVGLSFLPYANSQRVNTHRLVMKSVKAECQLINGTFTPVVFITLDNASYANFSNTVVYTLTTPSLASISLNGSSATFIAPNIQKFTVPSLINAVYTITANAGVVGGNTLTFTPNLSLCNSPSGPFLPDFPINVIIKDCPAVVNLVTNGSFFFGNDNSFISGLPLGCNSCSAGSYCVGSQLTNKCPSWPPNSFDHTLGNANGNYLLVDGNPNAPMTVWSDSIPVCKGIKYTFSFWAKSIYPDAFGLGLMINNNLVPVASVNLSGPTVWAQYATTWVSPLTGNIEIGIRQLTGGHRRDFGIDDIFFGFCCECNAK